MTLKNKSRGTVAGKKDPVVKGKAKPTVQGKPNPIVRGKAKPVVAKDAKANPRGASAGQVKGAKAFSSGRGLLKSLFSRLGVPAAIAGLGYQAYSAKKDVDKSVAQYEKQARKIAKESAALKAPPQRGNNLFLAGEKVNVNKAAMKALETREVKPRAMDKPAKAKESEGDRKTVKELSFGKAFRRRKMKVGKPGYNRRTVK